MEPVDYFMVTWQEKDWDGKNERGSLTFSDLEEATAFYRVVSKAYDVTNAILWQDVSPDED